MRLVLACFTHTPPFWIADQVRNDVTPPAALWFPAYAGMTVRDAGVTVRLVWTCWHPHSRVRHWDRLWSSAIKGDLCKTYRHSRADGKHATHVIADLIRNPEGKGAWGGRHTGFKAVSTGRGMIQRVAVFCLSELWRICRIVTMPWHRCSPAPAAPLDCGSSPQ